MYFKKINIPRALLYIFILPFFILAGFFVLGQTAHARIDIATDVIWDKSQSPIVISEYIWVTSEGNLTIEPGVVVKFIPEVYLIIGGVLNAIGTEEEKIIFTSIKDDNHGGDTNNDGDNSQPQAGDWEMINFGTGSFVDITI